ncbi:MAG TPA: amidohydrolase family protein [Candidatus Bathyarchaeia archaeon]|nr:amidohydrolase family protein [Candidatus Bathyarchaeia archaeon]
MKICDAHIHLGKSGPWQPYMNPTIYTDTLIPLLNKYAVEQAIVFPNPNVGDKYPEMNDYIAESVKKYPKRLVGFGRVDPRRNDAIQELNRIKTKLGLTGLKLHPFVECFRPDQPFFNKFFHKTNELKLPILFHTGDGFSSPGLILKIAKKYPKLHIILGHLREASINALAECENVYVETSGTLPDFIELAADIDENRVLFGSDIPYYRYPTQIAIVEAANISQKTKRNVFYENFRRMLNQK